VSAYSREAAGAALTAALKAFSAEHQKQYEAAINGMKRDLGEAQTKLTAAEQDYQLATKSLRTGIATNEARSEQSRNILVTNMATLINAQILDLRQRIGGYREALEPLRTYPTRIVGAVYAPTSPSTPGISILVAIGAVLGALAATAFALLRNTAPTPT
jgi:LPS O-antigen subunit length determinant protein (WzzB/FepE family)